MGHVHSTDEINIQNNVRNGNEIIEIENINIINEEIQCLTMSHCSALITDGIIAELVVFNNSIHLSYGR